nr:MAG TPA: hypothetical protein [Caudoviricetes sp.]
MDLDGFLILAKFRYWNIQYGLIYIKNRLRNRRKKLRNRESILKPLYIQK